MWPYITVLYFCLELSNGKSCEVISAIAGTGTWGTGLQNVAALSTPMHETFAVSPDNQGSVFAVEMGTNTVKKIDLTTGNISSFGNSAAFLRYPSSIACRSTTPVCFISSWNSNKIYQLVTSPTPIYSLYAGGAVPQENTWAINATLNRPWDLAFHPNGDLYFS